MRCALKLGSLSSAASEGFWSHLSEETANNPQDVMSVPKGFIPFFNPFHNLSTAFLYRSPCLGVSPWSMRVEGRNNSVCKAQELGNASSEGLESKGEWMEMSREGEEAARKVEGLLAWNAGQRGM